MSRRSQRLVWATRAAKVERAIVARAPMDDTIFPIPLRDGVIVRVQGLPIDLTPAEANKIGAVIMAYVQKEE